MSYMRLPSLFVARFGRKGKQALGGKPRGAHGWLCAATRFADETERNHSTIFGEQKFGLL
jgi:hypothetical protein